MLKVEVAKLVGERSVTLSSGSRSSRWGLLSRAIRVLSRNGRPRFDDVNVFPDAVQSAQIQLSLQYRAMLALGLPMPKFEDVEFRAYSQFGEDGILLYLFSVIGSTNKRCVEFCGGGGIDNTANLIINHGWKGLFFDGNERKIRKGQQFYSRCIDTKVWPPKLVHAWITAENINQLLEEHGYVGEIDLLSLDMDGIDYWAWKAVEIIQPRVVVLEYNNALGPDVSLTVPYRPDFVWGGNKISTQSYRRRLLLNTLTGKMTPDRFDSYYGASLAAFVKLGHEKGYRLVGCDRYGINAFFIREGIGEKLFTEIEPSACFTHPFAQEALEIRRRTIAHREWVEV